MPSVWCQAWGFSLRGRVSALPRSAQAQPGQTLTGQEDCPAEILAPPGILQHRAFCGKLNPFPNIPFLSLGVEVQERLRLTERILVGKGTTTG